MEECVYKILSHLQITMIALGYEETNVAFVRTAPRESSLEEDRVYFKIDLDGAQIDLMVYQYLGTEYDSNICDSRHDLKITGVAGAISMGELEKFVVEFNTKFNKIGNCLNNPDRYPDPSNDNPFLDDMDTEEPDI